MTFEETLKPVKLVDNNEIAKKKLPLLPITIIIMEFVYLCDMKQFILG